MKKSTKSLLFVASAAVAGMYAYNKLVASASTGKKLLPQEGNFYDSKNGRIFYTKQGKGLPVLLIHDLDPTASSYEWNKIVKRLEKNHTVYAIDLLGCGRSEKPGFDYTNYLYVQIITGFIKDVIGEKASVVATNLSASFVIMANQMDSDLFDKIILINPISVKQMELIPDQISKVTRILFALPIIGTFIYNLHVNPVHIDQRFRTKYFSNALRISSKTEDVYYEASHLEESHGKYLFSSILGNYVNINIKQAIKKIDKPVYILGSRDLKNNIHTIEEYRKLNKSFNIYMLSHSGLYPQLETPDKVSSIINEYLDQ